MSLYTADGLYLVVTGAVGVDGPGAPVALRFYGRGGAGAAGFALDLPRDAVVTVRAYDAGGREVARLAEGLRPAGVHRFSLVGTGRPLSSGVYFARAVVRSADQVETLTARVLHLR